MSVWAVMPSARPPAECNRITRLWQERGYRVAVWRDSYAMADSLIADYIHIGLYPGYYAVMNNLGKWAFDHDPECNWIVCMADDTEPDPNHTADKIADECSLYFARKPYDDIAATKLSWSTFGVMQPTGDRFAQGSIDRICGSPWIGHEFMRRMYGGAGAFNPVYTHMFGDQELQEVATKLGVLWQRPDLVHLHMHFMRESRALDANAVKTLVPGHLIEANTPAHWEKYKKLFYERKAAGFPGHQPIA